MVLAAVSEGSSSWKTSHITDPQGDRMVLDYLEEMGAKISCREEGIVIKATAHRH